MDRTAFRAARIYATLAADGLTANLKLSPAEQEFRCTILPDAFAPVSGGWGRMGWTTALLSALDTHTLAGALEAAWRDARPKPRPTAGGRSPARPARRPRGSAATD